MLGQRIGEQLLLDYWKELFEDIIMEQLLSGLIFASSS